MTDNKNDSEKLISWINGSLEGEDLKVFEETGEFKKYQIIINEVDHWTVAPLGIKTSYETLKSKKPMTKPIKWYQQSTLRWAAIFAFIMTAIVYVALNSGTVTYKTTYGETKEIVLPDNSKITLGPNSTIAYKRRQWKKSRKLKQTGTAFYEVEKGSPFEVSFNQGSLTVLGTSFEIRSLETYRAVTCYSGKVAVHLGDKQLELVKGKGVSVNDKEIKTFEFKTDWSPDLVRFTSTPLSVVFKSLENQFDIKIDASTIDSDRLYTGAFTKKSIETSLKMVCNPMNISFIINGQNVTLR